MKLIFRTVSVVIVTIFCLAATFDSVNAKITKNSYGQKIKTIDLKKSKFSSIVVSNREHFALTNEDATQYAAATYLYDVSFANYTTAFAKENGYPLDPKFINDNMSEGIGAFELHMKTDGFKSRCHMKFLLDKKFKTAMPDEEVYIRAVRRNDRMTLPKLDPKKESKEAKDYRINIGSGKEYEYRMNIFLGGSSGIKGQGTSLREYSRKAFKDYDYFKVSIGCGSRTVNVFSKSPHFWIKKAGAPDLSSISNHRKIMKDDFYKISIPQNLIDKFMPTMKMYKYGFSFSGGASIRLINYID